jgi:hypothetical protein
MLTNTFNRRKIMIEPNPFVTLQQIATGYILSRCLHVIADLGVADVLDETPRSAPELAALLEVHPGALQRMMSLLSAHGVFEPQGDRFGHSPASRLLREDHPQSARPFVQIFGTRFHWQAYGSLAHTLHTGQPATEAVIPEGMWAYLVEHPQESAIFDAAMASKSHAHIGGVLASYDFSRFGLVCDIAGGLGHFLQAMLEVAPATKGMLFELPHVIEKVEPMAAERLQLQAGDFFKDALPVCDAYVLMEVIHDWADPEAEAILRAVRRAALPEAKLLLLETIIDEHPGPDWAKVLDVQMMTMLGGLQRTRQQYEVLFEEAGFALTEEIDTGAGISIIEAVPISKAV